MRTLTSSNCLRQADYLKTLTSNKARRLNARIARITFKTSPLIICCTLFLTLSNISIASDLHSYSAEYSGEYKGMTLSLKRNFSALGKNTYRIHNEATSGLASFYEASDFKLLSNHTIQPSRYQYTTQYGPIVKKQDVVFDWDKKIAYDKHNKKKKPVQLTSSLADKISYQVLLRQMLKEGKQGTVSIALFNRGRLSNYNFTIKAATMVTTPAGQFKAIPVKRVYDDPRESQTLWFATDKDYVLIKFVQQDDDGQRYVLELSKLKFAATK